MQNLKIKITTKAPRNFKGKLTIQCSKPATTVRHYMLVPGILSENLSNWNEELQCFIGTDKITLHDNGIIGEIMNRLNKMLEANNFTSGKELFDNFRGVKGKGSKKVPTMGEFLDMIVVEVRDREVGASTNYQQYFTLLNKLGHILHLLSSSVTSIILLTVDYVATPLPSTCAISVPYSIMPHDKVFPYPTIYSVMSIPASTKPSNAQFPLIPSDVYGT